MASINNLSFLFKDKSFDLVVEIGVRFCESSLKLLTQSKIKKFVGIDPYLQYADYEHDASCKYANDFHYESAKQKLNNFSNAQIIRKTSTDAVEEFEDNSIDFIFIDGNHAYEYVLNDMEKYYPKLKYGGIMCGDDYFMRQSNSNNKKMVYEAVKEFTSKNNINYETCGKHRGFPHSWWFIK